jgi:lipopolysaccharide heptosyltransferase II
MTPVFQKILVVTLSNLGDVVLTLPVFEALASTFPGAELHGVVSDRAKEVFEGDPRIKRIIVYDKKSSWTAKLNFLKQIRRERYDWIIDLRRSLIGLLGRAKRRNSYLYFADRNLHRVQRHLLTLKNICGCSSSSKAAEWRPRREETVLDSPAKKPAGSLEQENLSCGAVRCQDPLNPNTRTVVAAVGSKSDIKKWPAEYYSKLLDRLIETDGCRVILIGDKNDAKDSAKVREGMRQSVTDLSGQTNFRELCAILREAHLVITNDSAPLHIADALKIPTLAIFGPTDPKKYGPRLAQSAAVHKTLFCAPCERAQCRYGHECMKELGVDEVYKKAVKILVGANNYSPLPRTSSNILVIRLDRIGDVVLSLPAIHALRERFPNASISLMVRPGITELVEGHPDIDEVIPYFYEKKGRHRFFLGYFRLMREIRKRGFDSALILHPSVRSHLLPFLAGIPERIGFDSQLPFLLTKKVPDLRNEGKKHESEYTLDVVNGRNAEAIHELPPRVGPCLPVYEDEVPQIPEGRFIAIHPGASCPSKRWPIERFAELGKKILPRRMVIVGGVDEKKEGEFLKKELGAGVLDLTGQLNLKALAALLKKADVLVSNDSGPVHIAAAVGTRTLTIFGRNQAGLSAARWRALGEGHPMIQKDVGCVVCLAHRCTIDFECLRAVQVEEVFCALKEMLSL